MSKRIGLIDVDGHNFPNLPLMKISAWHKAKGDLVEWYDPMFSGKMDKVYLSKVFSFSEDYPYYINADEIIKGGSGYCISVVDGKEVYDSSKDIALPYEIEHIYPDYSIYPEVTKNVAYGYLTRGCPRQCSFCHTSIKDGKISHKVADLKEFWNGQKQIVLLDQNILACKDWRNLLQQLIDSKATVEFNGGLDIRLITKEKAEMISKIRVQQLHFAWDQYKDIKAIVPKLKQFKEISKMDYRKLGVYVLCGFDTSFEQDLERVYTLRDLGYSPYVMLYNKENIPKGHKLRKLQRWVNNRFIFSTCKTFEEYTTKPKKEF